MRQTKQISKQIQHFRQKVPKAGDISNGITKHQISEDTTMCLFVPKLKQYYTYKKTSRQKNVYFSKKLCYP